MPYEPMAENLHALKRGGPPQTRNARGDAIASLHVANPRFAARFVHLSEQLSQERIVAESLN
jgi:hypothetical protein